MRLSAVFLICFVLLTFTALADYTCDEEIAYLSTIEITDGLCPCGCQCVTVPLDEYEHMYRVYYYYCSGSVLCPRPCTAVTGPSWAQHWVCDPRFCPDCECWIYSDTYITCYLCFSGE